MKKLLSLVLCLALLLPTMAMAEIVKTTYTVDFGDFTIELDSNDYYETAAKANNSVLAIVYPGYDPNSTTSDNFNIVWSATDATAEINLYGGIEKYASLVLASAESQYTAMGIKMTDAQVINAAFADGIGLTLTYCTLDYTGAGVDLVSPLYQLQVYYCMGDAGTYIFSFTAVSLEALETMSSYLDTVVFK